MLLKAYLRRGQALEQNERYKDAIDDFDKVCEIQPTHKLAKQAIERCKKFIKEDSRSKNDPSCEHIDGPKTEEIQEEDDRVKE